MDGGGVPRSLLHRSSPRIHLLASFQHQVPELQSGYASTLGELTVTGEAHKESAPLTSGYSLGNLSRDAFVLCRKGSPHPFLLSREQGRVKLY